MNLQLVCKKNYFHPPSLGISESDAFNLCFELAIWTIKITKGKGEEF